MKTRLVYLDGTQKVLDTPLVQANGGERCTIPPALLTPNVRYADVLYDYFCARAGDPGYFVTDAMTAGVVRTNFTARADAEQVYDCAFVGCYGWNRGTGGTLGIVTGLRTDFGMVLGVRDQTYYAYPRFYLDGDVPDEAIEIEFYDLADGSDVSMAKKYRAYQLEWCGCVPLRDRVAADPRLKKSMDAISVRVRQGWKPVPSPVENQTPDTEPPMRVACTFDRVGDIADAFKRHGIDRAEFCLVGWNCGGHDGRFPQIFPPDPRLGGAARLRAMIRKLKSDGFGVVCHDDATAAYTIADCFDESYLLKERGGAWHARPFCWSGGRPYKICPQAEYERFESVNQPKLAALGFEGTHYIDVISILPLLKCRDPRHPLTRRQSAEWYRKIMRLSRSTFGGFSSEGGFDFAASDMDFVLYPSFDIGKTEMRPLCDEILPFWYIAYHGIIMYNPGTYTLNYGAKGTRNRLKFFELGGRPLVCYYANFSSGNNWMGREDFVCDTDAQLEDSVSKIQQMAADYALLEPERYEFIENHEKLADDVYRTTYANGTQVTVDYQNETVEITRP